MTSIFKLTGAALALLVGLAVAPALAANAYVNQLSNVYKNANTSSQVIYQASKGELVTVIGCQANLCKLQLPGPDGWIKQSRLGGLNKGKPSSNIPFSFGLSIGGDGKPSISIGIGNGDLPVLEEEEEDRVCFYKSSNFNGSSFCVESGDADDSLSGGWNDSISSIRIYGDAEILVCTDDDLEGICSNIYSSKSSLPNALNNEISSYEAN